MSVSPGERPGHQGWIRRICHTLTPGPALGSAQGAQQTYAWGCPAPRALMAPAPPSPNLGVPSLLDRGHCQCEQSGHGVSRWRYDVWGPQISPCSQLWSLFFNRADGSAPLWEQGDTVCPSHTSISCPSWRFDPLGLAAWERLPFPGRLTCPPWTHQAISVPLPLPHVTPTHLASPAVPHHPGQCHIAVCGHSVQPC